MSGCYGCYRIQSFEEEPFEDEYMYDGWMVSNLFTKRERLEVKDCSGVSCSTEILAKGSSDQSYVVKMCFGQCKQVDSTQECQNNHVYCVYDSIESLNHWSNCQDGFQEVLDAMYVQNCVGELREKCLLWLDSLQNVTFCSSAKFERIPVEAFCGTSIECASIPDCVVELSEKCFFRCASLQCVTFGVSSKLERIGAEAFYWTNIETLFIPDCVVELGEKCFY